MGKLDASEVELVEHVVAGAEVNYSAIYMLVCFALGCGAGYALAQF